jgi:hypothetical protein
MARDATRRRVLAIGAMTLPLAAAGCKGLAALGNPPKAAPDVAVISDAIAVETHLIAHYGAVLAAVPALAGTLRPLLAQHHEHLARLRARLIVPPGRPSPSASPRAPRPPRCWLTWRPRRRRSPSCWPASRPRRRRTR